MSIPTSQDPNMRVFDWLGNDSKHVPYYLHALNLVWSDEGVEHDLQIYRRVAGILAAEPVYRAVFIREASWRHSLAGCVCLRRRWCWPARWSSGRSGCQVSTWTAGVLAISLPCGTIWRQS